MLFVTNRIPEKVGTNEPEENSRITFDLQNTGISKKLYFCKRIRKNNYTKINSETFFSELKDGIDSGIQVLLYIHGFNNTPEDHIFPTSMRLKKLIKTSDGKELVCVVPLIWPCDDDFEPGPLTDYQVERDASACSGRIFCQMIGMFDKWFFANKTPDVPCVRPINVLTHSLGARLLREALAAYAKRKGGVNRYFHSIFLAAPDIVNHTFEPGEDGRFISRAARKVVVYHANDDLAMFGSKLANAYDGVNSARLGMAGPEDMNQCPENVHSVDCDNINLDFDPHYGHTYFLEHSGKISPVIDHMAKAIKTGRIQPDDKYHQLGHPPNDDVLREQMD